MTEKLFYKDAYIKEFDARILSVEPCNKGFDIVLDRTSFFPEEGGQYSDTGYIGSARVFHAYEISGTIHHVADKAPETDFVHCVLNFDERYEKMQIHTGEHIVSGVFHSLYGYDNVGFHLGADLVTMDINAVLNEDDIRKAELIANDIIYKNVPVEAYFPDESELSTLVYRTKLDLKGNVRIVKIGEYDSCACCAPHVASSAEVGIIRLLDYAKHRGGTRISITAGKRAFRESLKSYEAVRAVSAALSVPKEDIAEGVQRMLAENEALRLEIKRTRAEHYLYAAKDIAPTENNLVLHYPKAGTDDIKTLANALIDRVGGILVLLSGEEGSLKYLIVSKSKDLRAISRDINTALCGRGGGKPEAIQGSFGASLSEIRAYFKN